MPYSLDDLPIIESVGRIGRRPTDAPTVEAYQDRNALARRRRRPLGLSLGMRVASFLQERRMPSSAELADIEVAAAAQYDYYFDCATQPDYNGVCATPCWGFADHHMDSFYCATCDEQAADPTNNPSWAWHYVGTRGAVQYIDREPDVCAGKDAWKWKVRGSCGNCNTESVFRCHDGYKKYPDATNWDSTICEGLISCDGNLTVC